MLNYIWAGLIAFAIVFALFQDVQDSVNNTWQNGEVQSIQLISPTSLNPNKDQQIRILAASSSDTLYARYLNKQSGAQLLVGLDQNIPPFWAEVAKYEASETADDTDVLRLNIQALNAQQIKATLPEVHFIKIKAVTQAAFDMAETAVKLALGLVGVMAFWLGLMRIAYESGLIKIVNKAVAPLMGYLFPDVPKDHPAIGAISMNMAANILGLGNAATPLGIQAMEELQKLNPNKDTATNAMGMFLAINTSSVQLLPPATLIALIGSGVNQLMIPLIGATIVSTIVAISAAKWFSKREPTPLNTEEV